MPIPPVAATISTTAQQTSIFFNNPVIAYGCKNTSLVVYNTDSMEIYICLAQDIALLLPCFNHEMKRNVKIDRA